MSWFWFAFLPERPADAYATAPAYTLDGGMAGYLAAWTPDRRRPRHAMQIHPATVTPSGAEAWVSLALSPSGIRVLYDDPAVCQAMRAVLAGPPSDAMSTLARDSSTIGGAFTAVHGASPARLMSDPFARVFPARIMRVESGFVGTMLPLAGPGIQRYSGAPWPWDRFAS